MEDDFGCENQINFSKTAYVTIGSILKKSIVLKPLQKKEEKQQLLVCDERGIIYIVGYNMTNPEIKFKSNVHPKELRNILLPDNSDMSIMAYYTSGNSLYSIGTNPEITIKIDLDIVDNIKCLYYIGKNFWVVYNNFLSYYEVVVNKSIPKGNYDNIFEISSIYASTLFSEITPFCILGSDEGKIKCIDFENNEPKVFLTLLTKGAVTCITQYLKTKNDNTKNTFIFGTQIGSHGVFTITNKDNAEINYELNTKKEYSDVVEIKIFDINQDKLNEIILVRSNGILEIYSIGESFEESMLLSKYETKEHITGLDIGVFKKKNENEIILSTLSGLVFGLSPELVDKKKEKKLSKKELKADIARLTSELSIYRESLKKKQEEFKKNESSKNINNRNIFKAEYKLSLNPYEKVFNLTIDSEFPIEIIVLHCSAVDLSIVKLKTKEVSLNIIDPDSLDDETKSHTKFMATLKPKSASHRIEVILRTFEGPKDTLTITIIPNNKPKTAQILSVPIYSLSFHQKYEPELNTNNLDDPIIDLKDESIVNKLIIEGLKASELIKILYLIIPNFPVNLENENVVFLMKSSLLNTILEISVDSMTNKGIIRSIDLSTLMILKEQITLEANKWKKEVFFNSKIKNASVFKMIDIFHPKIEKIFKLETEYKILNAFKELNEIDNINDLPDEYLSVLNHADTIKEQYFTRAINLKYYIKLVEFLITNLSKIVTVDNLNEKIQQVNDLFNDYSYDKIKKIFDFLET